MTVIEKNMEILNERYGFKKRYKLEGKLEAAKKMQEKGFDMNTIMEITGLSKEDIQQFKN